MLFVWKRETISADVSFILLFNGISPTRSAWESTLSTFYSRNKAINLISGNSEKTARKNHTEWLTNIIMEHFVQQPFLVSIATTISGIQQPLSFVASDFYVTRSNWNFPLRCKISHPKRVACSGQLASTREKERVIFWWILHCHRCNYRNHNLHFKKISNLMRTNSQFETSVTNSVFVFVVRFFFSFRILPK